MIKDRFEPGFSVTAWEYADELRMFNQERPADDGIFGFPAADAPAPTESKFFEAVRADIEEFKANNTVVSSTIAEGTAGQIAAAKNGGADVFHPASTPVAVMKPNA